MPYESLKSKQGWTLFSQRKLKNQTAAVPVADFDVSDVELHVVLYCGKAKPATAHKGTLSDIANAYNAEEHLNTLRNNYRDAVIEDLESGAGNYQTMVYYMDIMNTYERMGDFMINISQDLQRGFVGK